MINKLINLANYLDRVGYIEESSYIDRIIKASSKDDEEAFYEHLKKNTPKPIEGSEDPLDSRKRTDLWLLRDQAARKWKDSDVFNPKSHDSLHPDNVRDISSVYSPPLSSQFAELGESDRRTAEKLEANVKRLIETKDPEFINMANEIIASMTGTEDYSKIRWPRSLGKRTEKKKIELEIDRCLVENFKYLKEIKKSLLELKEARPDLWKELINYDFIHHTHWLEGVDLIEGSICVPPWYSEKQIEERTKEAEERRERDEEERQYREEGYSGEQEYSKSLSRQNYDRDLKELDSAEFRDEHAPFGRHSYIDPEWKEEQSRKPFHPGGWSFSEMEDNPDPEELSIKPKDEIFGDIKEDTGRYFEEEPEEDHDD